MMTEEEKEQNRLKRIAQITAYINKTTQDLEKAQVNKNSNLVTSYTNKLAKLNNELMVLNET